MFHRLPKRNNFQKWNNFPVLEPRESQPYTAHTLIEKHARKPNLNNIRRLEAAVICLTNDCCVSARILWTKPDVIFMIRWFL